MMIGHKKNGWDAFNKPASISSKGTFSNNLAIAPLPQPSMPAPSFAHALSDQNNSTKSFGVFQNDKTTELNYVYRGTSSAPESKFSSGFTARGQNLNLSNHVFNWPSNSAYVSSSLSKNSAANYSVDSSRIGFVYEINPPTNGVNVENHLYDAFTEGHIKKSLLEKCLSDHEISIPHKIEPSNIKGAWQVEKFTDASALETFEIKSEFIPNPEYLPSPAVRLAHVGKALGHAAIAVGAGIDSYNLITAGSHNGFLKEATRVAAGWTAAATMGAGPAEACTIIGGSVAGPVGALIGGIGCGALGSAIGYIGASQMVEKGLPNDAFDKASESVQKMYHKGVSFIDDKVAGWQLSNAMKQLDSKQAQEAADKHYIPSIIVDMLKTSMIEKNVALGSELFSDSHIMHLDKSSSLPVTNYLVKIGARCNRSAESYLRSEGADDVADLCSKDSLPTDEKKKEKSRIAAEICLWKEELIYPQNTNSGAKPDTVILSDALNGKQTHTQSLQLFSKASQLKSSGTMYEVMHALTNHGYRCDVQEEQHLRNNGNNYIANICSMPPVAQVPSYRKKY